MILLNTKDIFSKDYSLDHIMPLIVYKNNNMLKRDIYLILKQIVKNVYAI